MKQEINKVYQTLKEEFSHYKRKNSKENRLFIKECLEVELPGCTIICDETNNTWYNISECEIMVRVSWKENNGYSYMDLQF